MPSSPTCGRTAGNVISRLLFKSRPFRLPHLLGREITRPIERVVGNQERNDHCEQQPARDDEAGDDVKERHHLSTNTTSKTSTRSSESPASPRRPRSPPRARASSAPVGCGVWKSPTSATHRPRPRG